MNKTAISLFSGAGGMDIGFKNAGFRTVVAVELDSSCCETLRTNFPALPIIEGDLNNISSNDILEAAKLKPLECDVVIGGPPCQSFSLAGKRMGMDDPRGKLILEFARVVRDTLPKTFVLENVKGMANWAGGKAIDAVLNEFTDPISYDSKKYTYELSYKVLKASDYGAPQHRERLFIIGNRVGNKFVFPEPTHHNESEYSNDLFKSDLKPYVTVKDAILSLPSASPPSEMAQRISRTIKDRIDKHGY
jgi:DNA (cytosine-5)-methyltransferase 1